MEQKQRESSFVVQLQSQQEEMAAMVAETKALQQAHVGQEDTEETQGDHEDVAQGGGEDVKPTVFGSSILTMQPDELKPMIGAVSGFFTRAYVSTYYMKLPLVDKKEFDTLALIAKALALESAQNWRVIHTWLNCFQKGQTCLMDVITHLNKQGHEAGFCKRASVNCVSFVSQSPVDKLDGLLAEQQALINRWHEFQGMVETQQQKIANERIPENQRILEDCQGLLKSMRKWTLISSVALVAVVAGAILIAPAVPASAVAAGVAVASGAPAALIGGACVYLKQAVKEAARNLKDTIDQGGEAREAVAGLQEHQHVLEDVHRQLGLVITATEDFNDEAKGRSNTLDRKGTFLNKCETFENGADLVAWLVEISKEERQTVQKKAADIKNMLLELSPQISDITRQLSDLHRALAPLTGRAPSPRTGRGFSKRASLMSE